MSVFFVLQLAFLCMGFALGGASTKIGGAFLLLSLFFCGACIGWFIREKRGEGGE